MREPTTEESWLDTWISGCQENMNQCSGCLIDEKECQTAYDAISRRLEKPVPRVTRKQMAELLNIGHQFAMETMGDGGKMSYSESLTLALDEIQDKLTEFNIEASKEVEPPCQT